MITDFHSHVLPGVDDGSKNLDQSIRMLQMLFSQGIMRVVATPHFYPQHDTPENFMMRRDKAERMLRKEMLRHSNMPELLVGAEVYYFHGISDCDFLQSLTIGNSKCVLIEMPSTRWTESMYQELADIYEKQRLKPVIAHVDRYIGPFHTDGIPDKLSALPVYVQANAEAFQHLPMRQMMLRLLRNEQVQLLGSDCHDTVKRSPNLDKTLHIIQKKLGNDAIEFIQYCEKQLLSKAELD